MSSGFTKTRVPECTSPFPVESRRCVRSARETMRTQPNTGGPVTRRTTADTDAPALRNNACHSVSRSDTEADGQHCGVGHSTGAVYAQPYALVLPVGTVHGGQSPRVTRHESLSGTRELRSVPRATRRRRQCGGSSRTVWPVVGSCSPSRDGWAGPAWGSAHSR